MTTTTIVAVGNHPTALPPGIDAIRPEPISLTNDGTPWIVLLSARYNANPLAALSIASVGMNGWGSRPLT